MTISEIPNKTDKDLRWIIIIYEVKFKTTNSYFLVSWNWVHVEYVFRLQFYTKYGDFGKVFVTVMWLVV